MPDAASGPVPEESRERHVPVLRDRVIALLAPVLERPDAVLVDATLGLGGHAHAALERFASLRLVGIDRDAAALALSARRLAPFGDRVMLVQATYDEIARVLDDLGIARVDAVLFDLGVSSMQLDEAERGFAYAHDAPLDMRMDPSGGITAADVLNTYSAADLARVLREFGDERFAGRIAARVVAEREVEPFGSSERLVALIREVIPAPARRTGGHPAKRTFQALRIEVNGELEILRRAIPEALDRLSPGGRVVVLAYQSLEDRIVKRVFAAGARPEVPHGLPVVPDSARPTLRLLTRGAEPASADEIARNPRAASVRLRAVERIAA